jgi:glycosyltransferase involved in cell wall biosynthesis
VDRANRTTHEISRVMLAINVRWWNAEAAYAMNVARGLQQQGTAVWMIVNPGTPVHQKAVERQIPVITDILLDAVSPLRHWHNLRRLLQLIDHHQIQLINSFKSNGAFIFSLARRRRPDLIHIKTRGEARPPRQHILNRLLYGTAGCDGIITAGRQVGEWLGPLQLTHQRIRTIYFGESPLRTDSPTDPFEQRRKLGIDAGAFVVALLGRTQPVQGHAVLLEAIKQLRRPDIHLLLLIKDPDEFPEELKAMEAFLIRYQLQHQVTFQGYQHDLAATLSAVDLGVIPSLSSEINCRVAVELFALGVPVLAFPTGTLPELIEHGENGYLCSDHSPEALACGIEWMASDRQRSKTIGKNGQTLYQQRYTIEKLTEETLRFYHDCRGRRRTTHHR